MECYSLPILQYSVAAIKFTDTQLTALNACWNMAFRKNIWFSPMGVSQNVHMWYWTSNIYMLLDVSNSGIAYTLVPMLCGELC